MPLLTLLPRLILALAFATGGASMMMTRTQGPAAVTVVLCTGMGEVGLSLDARGNPIAAGHPCPDCTPAGYAVLPELDLLPQPTGHTSISATAILSLPLTQDMPRPQARDPPRPS
ncbi:MAG: hypothetical protein LBE86_09440 [Gemmobacter sp.]|jgi:hypothetical protein|nr:hypothetical protein [Gemmobacter sp.]